jgi:hypothetical protein
MNVSTLSRYGSKNVISRCQFSGYAAPAQFRATPAFGSGHRASTELSLQDELLPYQTDIE